MARVDAVRRLDALAHHAWRCAARLLGHDEQSDPQSQAAS
jgi:phosphate:Na+ symporter